VISLIELRLLAPVLHQSLAVAKAAVAAGTFYYEPANARGIVSNTGLIA